MVTSLVCPTHVPFEHSTHVKDVQMVCASMEHKNNKVNDETTHDDESLLDRCVVKVSCMVLTSHTQDVGKDKNTYTRVCLPKPLNIMIIALMQSPLPHIGYTTKKLWQNVMHTSVHHTGGILFYLGSHTMSHIAFCRISCPVDFINQLIRLLDSCP